MPLTAAERARRHRRHRKGDHSLCDGERCNGGGPTVRRNASRSERLWTDAEGDKLSGARRVLLEEACRLTDRLDRLDAYLRGDEDAWLRFHARNEDGSIVEVVVDKALAEARQQAATLKQILAEFRQGVSSTGGSRAERQAAKAGSGGTGAGSGIADLSARIAQRRASTAG